MKLVFIIIFFGLLGADNFCAYMLGHDAAMQQEKKEAQSNLILAPSTNFLAANFTNGIVANFSVTNCAAQLVIITNGSPEWARYVYKIQHSGPIWDVFMVDGLLYMNCHERDLSQPLDDAGAIWTTNECQAMYGFKVTDGYDERWFMNDVSPTITIFTNYTGTIILGRNRFTVADLEKLGRQ